LASIAAIAQVEVYTKGQWTKWQPTLKFQEVK
jgi:hypothetical protein